MCDISVVDSVSASSVSETPLLFLCFLATSLTVLVLAVAGVPRTGTAWWPPLLLLSKLTFVAEKCVV